MIDILETKTVRKVWFGNGQAIAVKNTIEHAVEAFQQAKPEVTPKYHTQSSAAYDSNQAFGRVCTVGRLSPPFAVLSWLDACRHRAPPWASECDAV